MYDAEENKHRIHIIDNFLNYRQPHRHIHLKEKETRIVAYKFKTY